MKFWINFSFFTLCLCTSLCWAQEPAYYRYKDKDGNTVMSSSLPPEYANSGYETLNSSGSVIEKVPPRESDEQIQKEANKQKELLEKQRQALIQQEKDQEQQHKDDILLKSFSSEQDIERARDDKLASIKVLEEIVRENIQGLERQLTTARNSAAMYQQSGQKIPDKLQKTIDDSVRQLTDNKAFLDRKAAEKKEIETKYQSLLEHFKSIEIKRKTATEDAPATTNKVDAAPVSTVPAKP